MKQEYLKRQCIAKCINNQNTKRAQKELQDAKSSHSMWVEIFKNFCASLLLAICIFSAVAMAIHSYGSEVNSQKLQVIKLQLETVKADRGAE